ASRPEPLPKCIASTRVPFGSTTIWFPIVNMFLFCGLMSRGVDQVAPPSVVIEKYGSPRNAKEWIAFGPALSLGCRLRSHTTYAVPAWNGSAVTDSLSLNTKRVGESSRWIVAGSLQVSPPSVEVLARIADTVCAAFTDRLTW